MQLWGSGEMPRPKPGPPAADLQWPPPSVKTTGTFDPKTAQLIRTLEGGAENIYSIGFSPDGSKLVSGGRKHIAEFWDVATGELRGSCLAPTDVVWDVAVSPVGTLVAMGSRDFNVYLWNMAEGQIVAELTGHTSEVRSVAFSPDGATVASGSIDQAVPFLGNVGWSQFKFGYWIQSPG